MRLLLIGDIVGKPGRMITTQVVAGLKKREQIDFVVANAENSAGGSGMTPQIYDELMHAGVDAITLGDHIFRRREIYSILESKQNIVKPANYPPEAPGRTLAVVPTQQGPVAVISLLGRVFMNPVDCPFAAVDRVLTTTRTFRPEYFDVARDRVELHATMVDVDVTSGQATAIRRLQLSEEEAKDVAAYSSSDRQHCDS